MVRYFLLKSAGSLSHGRSLPLFSWQYTNVGIKPSSSCSSSDDKEPVASSSRPEVKSSLCSIREHCFLFTDVLYPKESHTSLSQIFTITDLRPRFSVIFNFFNTGVPIIVPTGMSSITKKFNSVAWFEIMTGTHLREHLVLAVIPLATWVFWVVFSRKENSSVAISVNIKSRTASVLNKAWVYFSSIFIRTNFSPRATAISLAGSLFIIACRLLSFSRRRSSSWAITASILVIWPKL